MLVDEFNFDASLKSLFDFKEFGLDTETTGLRAHDRLFCITIASPRDIYYFNFNPREEKGLLQRDHLSMLADFFSRADFTWYISEAKFDMGMLLKEGIKLPGKVICLKARERVLRNDYFPAEKEYGLDAMAFRYAGVGKDDAVKMYISKHKLFTDELVPGKKRPVRHLHFDQVPLRIIQPYAERDAHLHLRVGMEQELRLRTLDKQMGNSPTYGFLGEVAENEIYLTKTCFDMEQAGIKIDRAYASRAIRFEQAIIDTYKEQFKNLTGIEFKDSRTVLVSAFLRLGLSYPTTAKGNPSFDAEALEDVDNPVANVIKSIRTSEKKIATYYSSFLLLADSDDVIHPNIVQYGTETGRMSYANPNLQNVPRDDEGEKSFYVRKCFVPRENYCFVSIDYKAQELRMMLDYAGQEDLIKSINDGADPHQATADLVGITRKQAKTLNFALLYGAGKDKIARQLGVDPLVAQQMKDLYFARLPKVKRLIRQVAQVAKNRGYIRNWMGRICYLKDTEFAYIMLNHLVQGGSADVCKVAMNVCHHYLQDKDANLLLQVHDELLFEVHRNELGVIPTLAGMMSSVYRPMNGMKMDVNVDHSWMSWGYPDIVEGAPC